MSTKPYPVFQHPKKSRLDTILFSLTCNTILQLHQFQTCSLDFTNPKTKKFLSRFRNICKVLTPLLIKVELFLWNRSRKTSQNGKQKGPIHKVHSSIPRKSSILSEWNILSDDHPKIIKYKANLATSNHNDDIPISICAPKNIISLQPNHSKDKPGTKNCLTLPSFKGQLNSLSSSDHVLLYFWGGGMSVKVETHFGVSLTRTILEHQTKRMKDTNTSIQNTPPNIILITPTYRLTPEHPFPASIIDCLSTLDFLIQNLPQHVPIHLAGESAGGNIVANLCFEAHKKYPGRIKSAYLCDPMLSPNCSSKSFYMNSKHGLANWAMWSWRSYLSLDNKDHEEYALRNRHKFKAYESYEEFVSNGSNEMAIQRSNIMNDDKIWKIINPTHNIPDGLASKNAANIVVSVASADPLYDEGVEFANALKSKGAKLFMTESHSSHTSGWHFDASFKEGLVQELCLAMFGT